jgi:hypothetical protein
MPNLLLQVARSESDQNLLRFTELADQVPTLVTTPEVLPISVGSSQRGRDAAHPVGVKRRRDERSARLRATGGSIVLN